MSELIAYKADVTIPVYGTIADAQVYLKSEADAAIADLEESHKKEVEQLLIEIVKLKNEIEVQKRLRDMALDSVPNVLKVMKIIQHQKYKRCLAMANNCRLRARWFGDNAFYKKEQWALQWHRRWLKIAERFKEAKEALELVKEANALCKEAK